MLKGEYLSLTFSIALCKKYDSTKQRADIKSLITFNRTLNIHDNYGCYMTVRADRSITIKMIENYCGIKINKKLIEP